MVVAFSLMVHGSEDERVAFQEADSLRRAGETVYVFSCYSLKMGRREKMRWLKEKLLEIRPDVIVCDTPLSVMVAHDVKKMLKKQGHPVSVVYDITEWYPSKKNLRNLGWLSKIFSLFILSFLSLWAGVLSDAFIFGEYYKSFPFKYLFAWKKSVVISYYANRHRVKTYDFRKSLKKECRLYYSGNLTEEKGFFRMVEVVKRVAEQRPETCFVLNVVTNSAPVDFEGFPDNLSLEYIQWQPFEKFCDEIGKNDIFFDLRDSDFENTHCLPIKIFYYMAAGRPVIYSDLKAIRLGVPECDDFGFYVSEKDLTKICKIVLRYIEDEELYRKHCEKGLILSEQKYNWEAIEERFLNFMRDVV